MEKIHNNNRYESENLIEHIEDAKNWLDKAKQFYVQANPTHAEMNLNLAQAEVKHVWELSRRGRVSKKHKAIPKRKLNHFIVAAVILVALGLVFGFRNNGFNKHWAVIFKPVAKSFGINSKLASTGINQEITKEARSSKVVSPDSVNLVRPISHAPKSKEQVELQPSSTLAGELSRERSEETTPNTVRVRQVLQFTIDEDALTKEASRSLRNGK